MTRHFRDLAGNGSHRVVKFYPFIDTEKYDDEP